MAYKSQVVRDRIMVERWVRSRPDMPTRKQAQAAFPDIPQKIIRAVLQSIKAQL